MEDGRCRLGLAGRLELVRRIEQVATLRAAAATLNVAPATAHRWWHRWQQASPQERASRTCLRARPPIPKSCPWRLALEAEQRILGAGQRTNLGPARLAWSAIAAQRSTRCSSAMGVRSDAAPLSHASPAAMSGPSRRVAPHGQQAVADL
jgi:transposase-like protein